MAFSNLRSQVVSGDLVFRNRAGVQVAKFSNTGPAVTIERLSATLGLLSFGAAEAVTIASGVATVTGTKSLIRLTSESSTSDQLDSIVSGVTLAGGEILFLIPVDTHTITVDDANIDLGAATRAVAPGGVLALHYNLTATSWQELFFLAGADNV